jgi:hypothetical protein
VIQEGGKSRLVGGANGQIKPVRPAQALPGRLDLKDPRSADAKLPVAHALDLLAQYGESSSLAGERAAAEERARREAEAEQRREAMRAFPQSGLQPH